MKERSSTSRTLLAKQKGYNVPGNDVANSPYPLPRLKFPNDGERVIAVKVLLRPFVGRAGYTTWVVDERPARRVGHGQLVELYTHHARSGIGMLSAITDLTRHWVTWTIVGSQTKCSLRVPVPWAVMSGIEGVAHVKHYKSLPALPPPHRAVAPGIDDGESNPYSLALTEDELQLSEDRLDGITRGEQWRRCSAPEECTGRKYTHASEGRECGGINRLSRGGQ